MVDEKEENSSSKAGPKVTSPAGFWVRFAAVVIDSLILMLLSNVVGQILGKLGFPGNIVELPKDPKELIVFQSIFGLIISAFISFFYFGWFYSNKGGSPGKLIFSLKVVDNETREYIGYWRAFLREYFCKIISTIILFIGFIMAGLRSDKRALHDMITGTQVVQDKD